MVVDNIINVNDLEINKADNEKLDQDVQQNYNEVASKMIRENNADLLSQFVSNKEIRDLLILEKITAQKESERKQLAEKMQPGLDVFYAMIMNRLWNET